MCLGIKGPAVESYAKHEICWRNPHLLKGKWVDEVSRNTLIDATKAAMDSPERATGVTAVLEMKDTHRPRTLR